MLSLLKKLTVVIAGLASIAIGAALILTQVKRLSEIDTIPDQQKLARTLAIIRTSTPANPQVLKVLFYGQSITRSGWVDITVSHWREKYPNTIFVVENLALGGFPTQALVRTTERDIAAFNPDLIVFHDYGDHRAYEKILRYFRSETAADVILQTDHAEVMPDPYCSEGLQVTLHRPPGCKGILWLKQRQWGDEMSYHTLPNYARKYGLALEPQRGWWRDYLLRTHTNPASLLRDAVHPNAEGNKIYADFSDAYFDNLVQESAGLPASMSSQGNGVSISAQPDGGSSGKEVMAQETVNFNGTRLEMLTSKAVSTHWQDVLIDGVQPKYIEGCYLVSRASMLPNVPDWPAIRHITLLHDKNVEDWTATIPEISPDQKTFRFTVKSSVLGDQGSGDSTHDFVASSGVLKIEPDDWMIEPAFEESHTPIHTPLEVHWSVTDQCSSSPEVIEMGKDGKGQKLTQFRYTLAAGLANKQHIATFKGTPSTIASIIGFRAYKPTLTAD